MAFDMLVCQVSQLYDNDLSFFFFFQAEDGIRDDLVTGVQTCALPICGEEDAVHLIMQAELTPATEQDVEETMPLLDDLQARDLVPEVRLVDSGYVSGDVLAKHAALGIELVGPLQQGGGWQHETGYGVG